MNRTLLLALSIALTATACSSRSADAAAAPGGTPAAKPTAAPTSWVRFQDPSEASFSMEVPRDWVIQGGMYRFGYFDVRATVDMRSPDGNIVLRFDDANVPPYVLPGPNKPAVGKPYEKPMQFQMMVENYRDAQSFAETYGKNRFKSVCQTLTTQPSTWKPRLPAAAQVHADKLSENSVSFACTSTSGAKLGTVYVRTALYNQGSFWQADPILSAITSADQMPVALGVLQHALDTFQISPQWQAHQQQMTQEGLAMIQRDFQTFLQQTRQTMQNFSSSMSQQVSGFEAQQSAQAAQVHSWGNILTGITDATDPLTGQQLQVWTGPGSNYYINGLGQTYNGNGPAAPGDQQLRTHP